MLVHKPERRDDNCAGTRAVLPAVPSGRSQVEFDQGVRSWRQSVMALVWVSKGRSKSAFVASYRQVLLISCVASGTGRPGFEFGIGASSSKSGTVRLAEGRIYSRSWSTREAPFCNGRTLACRHILCLIFK
jgi:hypothetical protein